MAADPAFPALVIDASVGIKWVVDEPGSDLAVALIGRHRLLAPALFRIEAANVLAMKARRGELTRAAADDAWRDLAAAPLDIINESAEMAARALALAHDLRHTVYDCVYLATALAENCPLITADRRFATAASALPTLAGRIRVLGEGGG